MSLALEKLTIHVEPTIAQDIGGKPTELDAPAELQIQLRLEGVTYEEAAAIATAMLDAARGRLTP